MFDLKKLQTAENKSLNQISSQTVLLLQTVFTQNPCRSVVILADITIAHRAHLTDFPVMQPGTVHSNALQMIAQQLPCQPEHRCTGSPEV